eukprot:COSAG06_NODE_56762_length_283_cov_0.836957_1_plen_72_part_10
MTRERWSRLRRVEATPLGETEGKEEAQEQRVGHPTSVRRLPQNARTGAMRSSAIVVLLLGACLALSGQAAGA